MFLVLNKCSTTINLEFIYEVSLEFININYNSRSSNLLILWMHIPHLWISARHNWWPRTSGQKTQDLFPRRTSIFCRKGKTIGQQATILLLQFGDVHQQHQDSILIILHHQEESTFKVIKTLWKDFFFVKKKAI